MVYQLLTVEVTNACSPPLLQISSVDLHCGYPAVLLEDKLLDKVYSELNVMRHNFFDSVQAARHHQRVIQQKAYLAPGTRTHH